MKKVIRPEQLNGTYEEKRKLVSQFNLMDDNFFSVVMENKAACEYLLTALLGRPVRYIRKNKTQYSIKNLDNHSVVLDALIEDGDGKKYNIEVQVGGRRNFKKRVRYYSAAIDFTANLGKRRDYSKMKDLYMIFISTYDPFKENKNHYEVEKSLKGSGQSYDDGLHIMYFNTAVDDGTELSRLLKYLAKSSENNDSFGALSDAVRFYKTEKKGVNYMCKMVNDYANDIAKEAEERGAIKRSVAIVDSMLKDNFPIETALKYARIDLSTYKKFCEDN